MKGAQNQTAIKELPVKITSISAVCLLLLVPFLNSSIFQTYSYFQNLSLWFLVLGILLVGIGIKLMKDIFNQHENFPFIGEISRIYNEGPYKIMRHPSFASLLLIFLGLTFVLDSLFSVLFFPFLFIYFEFMAYLKEKLVYSRQFQEKYRSYVKKTQKRIFPTPYGFLIFIIYALALYVGLLNLFLI
ncbi:MAG: methyltransferase family protein [archaeon]